MNKRISKKLQKMATVRDFTVQEAFDKVIEHFVRTRPEYCYFIDRQYDGTYQAHCAAGQPIVNSTVTKDGIIEKHYVKLEPEEVTFTCDDCERVISAQEDVDNEGLCDNCMGGKNEMWAAELKHEEYEFRNMKL